MLVASIVLTLLCCCICCKYRYNCTCFVYEYEMPITLYAIMQWMSRKRRSPAASELRIFEQVSPKFDRKIPQKKTSTHSSKYLDEPNSLHEWQCIVFTKFINTIPSSLSIINFYTLIGRSSEQWHRSMEGGASYRMV